MNEILLKELAHRLFAINANHRALLSVLKPKQLAAYRQSIELEKTNYIAKHEELQQSELELIHKLFP